MNHYATHKGGKGEVILFFMYSTQMKYIIQSQESLSKKELIKRASNLYQEKHGKLNKAEKKLFKERAKETVSLLLLLL